MIRWISMMFLATVGQFAQSATTAELMSAKIDVNDKASLQRGAKIYMNYCSGCHSLKYLRYNRMAKDLGLTRFDGEIDKPLLVNNLIFSQEPIHSPIRVAMPAVDSRQWFGVVPPDLSLETRIRGVDWVYTYLKSFYRDQSRPFGSNNVLVPGVAMPNVLEPLQGEQIAVKKRQTFDFGGETREQEVISHLLIVKDGGMTQHQFDQTLDDLVNFLAYAAEPIKSERLRLGWFVMLFLVVLLVVAYLLKKTYWARIK